MAEKTLKITVTLDANLPANVKKACNIQEPGKAAVTEYNVPLGKQLIIKDIFIKASGDVGGDGNAVVVMDGEKELYKSPNISTLLISNPSRPLPPPTLVIPGGHRLGIDFINESAVGTAAVTNTFYIKVDEVEAVSKAASGLEKLKSLFS